MTERLSGRHSPWNSTRISDLYLSALTRTIPAPAGEDRRHTPRETCEPGATFEETYPRYSFSVLTAAAIKVTGWLTGHRASAPKPERPGEQASC